MDPNNYMSAPQYDYPPVYTDLNAEDYNSLSQSQAPSTSAAALAGSATLFYTSPTFTLSDTSPTPTLSDASLPADNDTETPGKKSVKRGRPPGSKNKAEKSALKAKNGNQKFKFKSISKVTTTKLSKAIKGPEEKNASELKGVEENKSDVEVEENEVSETMEEEVEEKTFTRVPTENLLYWYRKYGKAAFAAVKNNAEKGKVYSKMADFVNGVCKTHYTKDQCKNKLSNLKRGYKKYLRLMNSSGEGVCMHSEFEYAEECEKAFGKDRDVHPITLVDSEPTFHSATLSDASTVAYDDPTARELSRADKQTPRERRRREQQSREEREAERHDEKRQWRSDLLDTLKALVQKIPDPKE